MDTVNNWSNVTRFTPTTGEEYDSYGYCWYKVHGNSIVQIHLGIKGLTANTPQTVFTLPSGVPKPLSAAVAFGMGGATYTAIARINVNVNGIINVTSDDAYCLADFMYHA